MPRVRRIRKALRKLGELGGRLVRSTGEERGAGRPSPKIARDQEQAGGQPTGNLGWRAGEALRHRLGQDELGRQGLGAYDRAEEALGQVRDEGGNLDRGKAINLAKGRAAKYIRNQIEGDQDGAELLGLFDQARQELSAEETEMAAAARVHQPDFPIFIVTLALIKDVLLETAQNLTGFTYPLTLLYIFLLSIIIGWWLWGKLTFLQKQGLGILVYKGGVKRTYIRNLEKKMIKWWVSRGVVTSIGEAIPFVSILPLTTIFVILAHYRHKEIVRTILKTAEYTARYHKKLVKVARRIEKRLAEYVGEARSEEEEEAEAA